MPLSQPQPNRITEQSSPEETSVETHSSAFEEVRPGQVAQATVSILTLEQLISEEKHNELSAQVAQVQATFSEEARSVQATRPAQRARYQQNLLHANLLRLYDQLIAQQESNDLGLGNVSDILLARVIALAQLIREARTQLFLSFQSWVSETKKTKGRTYELGHYQRAVSDYGDLLEADYELAMQQFWSDIQQSSPADWNQDVESYLALYDVLASRMDEKGWAEFGHKTSSSSETIELSSALEGLIIDKRETLEAQLGELVKVVCGLYNNNDMRGFKPPVKNVAGLHLSLQDDRGYQTALGKILENPDAVIGTFLQVGKSNTTKSLPITIQNTNDPGEIVKYAAQAYVISLLLKQTEAKQAA